MQILLEREKTHGDYQTQSATSQTLKNVMHVAPNWSKLSAPQRESLEMIAVKIARILHGDPNEVDHARDIAGYAMLMVNALTPQNPPHK